METAWTQPARYVTSGARRDRARQTERQADPAQLAALHQCLVGAVAVDLQHTGESVAELLDDRPGIAAGREDTGDCRRRWSLPWPVVRAMRPQRAGAGTPASLL